jgi:hypothetical protein
MNRRSILAGGLLTFLLAAPVLASHVTPEVVDGASSCGPLAPGTVELLVSVPQDVGEVVDGDFTVDVALDGNVGNGSISFSNASLPVAAAFVAGTGGGNLYRYEEPVTEDDGLVAPDGGPIADVSFCYVSAEGEASATAAASAEASAEATSDTAGSTDGITTPATDAAPAREANPAGLVLIVTGLLALAAGLGLALSRPARVRRR